MDFNNAQVRSMRLATPESLFFRTFSTEEIRELSVVNVVTPLSFNSLNHPLPGGLYDPLMGAIQYQGSLCATCGLPPLKCAGHFGHIELPLPVLNPMYYKPITVILKMACLHCHNVLIPHSVKCILIGQLNLLHHGYIVEAQEMAREFNKFLDETYTNWKNRNIDTNVAITAEIEAYVESVMHSKEGIVKEWKGEADLRNMYIKSALCYCFKGKTCPCCNIPLMKLSFVQNNILVPKKLEVASKFKPDKSGNKSEITSSNYSFLMPNECKDHLTKLFMNDGPLIASLLPVLTEFNSENKIDSLFMEVIPVPPINIRPINFLDGKFSEHPQNYIFKDILNDCLVLRSVIHLMNKKDDETDVGVISEERMNLVDKLRGSTYGDKLQFAWIDLQRHVDNLLDVEGREAAANKNGMPPGLKQIIEKKEGIIRMHMMGKRVNFAARTVITPDPNLNIDEIGIPELFARKLTYPVPVTYYNVNELRNIVINGPYLHPGANLVENEDGTITKLDGGDLGQREGIAKKLLTPSDKKGIKIVHRHLVNGDILLLNRQPTLHKPSIMAHKARILKGEKTFRMHYANCKAYNADFDGDEMNAHFPQNEVARSEGYNLVSSGRQYLVPKDGTPLSGLIQDHVVSGVRLSIKGRFFTREEYMQLCFQGLTPFTGNIKHLPPCMIKPVPLWSGKQVISTLILNVIPKGYKPLNLTSKAKISPSAWPKNKVEPGTPFRNSLEMTEAEVVIRGGELLCGVLDKMHYGATPYSLVHCIHELYGSEVSSRLLSSFSKLFTAFLQTEGFTLGVEDILVVKKADARRKKLINAVRLIGEEVATKALDSKSVTNLREALAEAHNKDPTFRAVLDHQYKTALDNFTNKINKACLPFGLFKTFPTNDLQLMVQSGAKGSTVNTMQISCLLGQIELEGKRPPLMISGRSLPSFPPYDTSPRAGGFIDGRFMTGIRPQEFFFHCMAGREGLIDTAVKTSRSGYLQRCLVKHLEGLSVNYDLTVRDSDGSVIQYLYGEDGMEVTKCQFLKEKQLPFLVDNIQALADPDVSESLKNGSDLKGVKKHKKSLKKWRKSHENPSIHKPTPFALYSQQANLDNLSPKFNKDTGRSVYSEELCDRWITMEDSEKKKFRKMCQPSPDTVVSKLQPDRHFGSVTEKLDAMVNNYLKNHGSLVDAQTLEDVVHLKALESLANPGEPVGMLAAQSIGEPSTQMTLNTFHFAGRGEMNVTLGIPRLREILMTASKNIKTPSMEIPFRTDVSKVDKKANKLRRSLARVTMADVLEFVEVTEKLQLQPTRRQIYTLKFKFLPKDAYTDDFSVTPKQILKHFESKFIKLLLHNIKYKNKSLKSLIQSEEKNGKDDDEDLEEVADEPEERGLRKKRQNVLGGDDADASEEDDENDDDDATTQRRRARQNEEHNYSDLEDEDEEVRQEIEGTKPKSKKDDEESDQEISSPKKHVAEKEEVDRKVKVTSMNNVVSYIFDTVNQLWCEVTLAFPTVDGRIDFSTKLKVLAAQSVIREVQGIRKAFLPSTTSGEKMLKIDGKNLMEMYNHAHLLDVNRLYTNDIHAVAETYGIEAAAKVIVKEIQGVFEVYGITVDPRHLTLVADYMTFDGTYRALNRVGMEGGASPLQQMSFEASLAFLRSSVLRSKKDDLLSPSARLMLGRPVKSGTSCFNVLYSLDDGSIF